jgi:ketosteroid isomerase-like protein
MGESDPGTPELIELIRVGFERWANEDFLGTLELFAEDCELKPLLGQVEGVTYRGHEGVRRWFTDVHTHWSAFRPQLHAFCERDSSLLVTGQIHAQGRHSGVEFDTPMYWRFTFRGRSVVKMETSREPTDAHRAAGLTDTQPSPTP